MSLICGHLASTSMRQSVQACFNFDGVSFLSAEGFTEERQWSDSSVLLSKFARDAKLKQWRQPPVFDQSRGVAIIADARLHDRANLSAALNLGPPDELSDNTLIIAAYCKWGRDCPKYLIGDYAFAIWDSNAKKLFCARDHIGAKQFYYAVDGPEFCFASDLRIILDAAKQPFELHKDWLIETLFDRRLASMDQTYYRGINALPPGHSLILEYGKQPRVNRYWEPEKQTPIILKNDEEYAEALRENIDRAVSDCLFMPMSGAADGYAEGLGIHVSGGLDSSSIAALANRNLRKTGRPMPHAFCWQPEPKDDLKSAPEYLWLEKMMEQEDMDLTHISMDGEELYRLYMMDGTRTPITSTLKIEQAVQSEAYARNIGVILSGWGGDELASHNGRTYFPWLLATGRWRTLADNLKDFEGSLVKNIAGRVVRPMVARGLAKFLPKKRRLEFSGQQWVPARHLLNQTYTTGRGLNKRDPGGAWDVRRMMLYLLNYGHITERIESWAIHGRKLGLEYRYPLLDRRVIEFALSVPADQFRRAGRNRYIFRNAMRGILPDAVVDNLSKTEPIRVASHLPIQAEVLKRISGEMHSGQIKARRTEFVNMPRLQQVMDGKTKEQIGAAEHAVQLLDFA